MTDLGFVFNTQDDFARLANRAIEAGTVCPAGDHGSYLRWSPGEGVELWLQVDAGGTIVGFNPHFSGPSRMRIGLTAFIENTGWAFDGSLHAWADPPDTNPELGHYPFIVDIPDFVQARTGVACPSIQTVQVAAFAHELTCFASDAEYEAQQDEPRFAAESFIPAGLFQKRVPSEDQEDEQEEDSEGTSATAIFTGHVLSARIARNPVTGNPFHVLTVRTLGGQTDVVADPEIVDGVPIVGGVVTGHFWLSGRLA